MTGEKKAASIVGPGGAMHATKFDQEVSVTVNTRGLPLRGSSQEKRNVNRCSQTDDEQINKKKIRLDGQMCGEDNAQVSSKSIKGDVNDVPHNFKGKITEAIKKQVLDGLGEAGKAALQDLQVIDIEEIRKCTAANDNSRTERPSMKEPEHPGLQQYVAKVKLMACLFIPLTVKADQELQNTEEEQQEGQAQFDQSEEALESPTKKEDKIISLLEVPDFEFYDFDSIRNENMFAKGQIWALYDDIDGMPRHYAQIKKVSSFVPFNVQIAWLEPRCSSAEARKWLESGNSLTCGQYDIGELKESSTMTMTDVECFSHVVKQEAGQGGKVRIYPSEGDVWAIYKGWREFDGRQRIKLGYEIVQVVTNNEEGSYVSVIPLVKFKGFRTVFTQKERSQKPLCIPKRDIIRFSHQIPMHKLVEDKVPEGLERCLELDPASIPVSTDL